MSPQFVDFDADGALDLVVGTYDGSPQWARGAAAGFAAPQPVLDARGERIRIRQYWDHGKKRWFGMADDGDGAPAGHATSAAAFDVDGDGDLDLLLGDHLSGRVWWRRNDGTARAPAFAAGNEPLHAGGAPLDVPGTVATLRVRDWDGDGRLDLLLGGMGDANTATPPGAGVFLCRNEGDGAAARFAAPITLVPISGKGARGGPDRPDSGLYPDCGDLDGDGDMDLVVGGWSHWTPVGRELTAAEQARVAAIAGELAALDAELAQLTREAQAASAAAPAAERSARYTAAFQAQREQREANRKNRTRLGDERDALVPPARREAFVWFYANTTPRAQ